MSQLFACASAAVARDRRRRHGDRSHIYYLFQSTLDTNNAGECALLCYSMLFLTAQPVNSRAPGTPAQARSPSRML